MSKKKIMIIGVVAVALLCGGAAYFSMNNESGITIKKISENEYLVTDPDGTTTGRSLTPVRREY